MTNVRRTPIVSDSPEWLARGENLQWTMEKVRVLVLKVEELEAQVADLTSRVCPDTPIGETT